MTETATVLTVEDDPVTRADLRVVLEDAGFTVVPDARDGLVALELARRHEPDVVLLDLGLPRLGGVEAVRRLLAERDAPVVALTGRSPREAAAAVDAGAVAYVLKPFQSAEEVGALLDAVERFRERRVLEARRRSREAVAELLGLFGLAPELSEGLVERAYRQGWVWREVD